MADEMTFGLEGMAESVIQEVRTRLARHGGELVGGPTGGTFAVKRVHGKYGIRGKVLTVSITKKPFYIPTALIRSIISKHLKEICAGPRGERDETGTR